MSMTRQWPVLSFLWAAEERRYVRRESRKVLATYHAVRTQHPAVTGTALYEEVVAMMTGVSSDAARGIVRAAEKSFCEWPCDRDLTLRDVVHYLCFEGFSKSHDERNWTRTLLREVVDKEIPKGL
jgi:hypothetical protein